MLSLVNKLIYLFIFLLHTQKKYGFGTGKLTEDIGEKGEKCVFVF